MWQIAVATLDYTGFVAFSRQKRPATAIVSVDMTGRNAGKHANTAVVHSLVSCRFPACCESKRDCLVK
jgi:hypothetical protein